MRTPAPVADPEARRTLLRVVLAVLTSLTVLHPLPARAEEYDWVGKPAPEISSGTWLNSAPLKLSELRGKVVLVEFWTFACVNCRNTLSHLREWNSRYGGEHFVILGVHTPELARERDISALGKELVRLDVTWPVVTDNDERTWNSYHQRYWPVMYLLDKRGVIRYVHAGEGAYGETERIITALLGESM